MTNGIYSIDEIRTAVAPVAEEYGIKRVILFGSYARGNATADSDVDLLIELEKPIGLFRRAAMLDSFEQALGKRVDCVNVDSVSLEFRYGTLEDEVLLYA